MSLGGRLLPRVARFETADSIHFFLDATGRLFRCDGRDVPLRLDQDLVRILAEVSLRDLVDPVVDSRSQPTTCSA